MKKIFTLLSACCLLILCSNNIFASAILVSISSQANCTCNGSCNGYAYTSVTGNQGTVTYLWSPGGQTTQNVTGLCPGTYTVTATDQYDQTTSQATVVITQPAAMTVSLTRTDVSCNGGNNGTITSTVSGGTPAYTYYWSPGSYTTANVSGLPAGNYNVTVTDANGCSGSAGITVSQPAALTANAGADATICVGSATTLSATYAGGTGTWYTSWSPSSGLSSTTLPNVSASPTTSTNYVVTVTDDNGCTASDQVMVNVLSNPTVTAGGGGAICSGACASLYATGALTYSWSPSTGLSSTTTSSPTACPTSSTTYTVTGTNANGCSASTTVTVTVNPIQPLNAGPDTMICMYDFITYNIGGTWASTSWSPATGLSNPNSPNTNAYPTATTTYTLTFTDINGCVSTDNVTISVNPEIITSLAATNPSTCGGTDGSINATVTGGTTPYTYSWCVGDVTEDISGYGASSLYYIITVTDAVGCVKKDSTLLNDPNAPMVTLSVTQTDCNDENGAITANVTGGTAPYVYAWSNAATTATISGLNSAGNPYTVTVTDANNCMGSENANLSPASSTPGFEGAVYYQGNPVGNARVTVFKVGAGAFMAVDSTTTDGGGNYYFPSIPARDYIIKAELDSITYPNAIATYNYSTHQWANADTLNTTCNGYYTAMDINVIDLPPLAGGNGNISGDIIDITGSFKTQIQGDPLPGVDVSLEQNPGSNLRGETQTDINGHYSFDNVPDGDYTIYVDVPGLDMVATYDLSIAPGSEVHNNNIFYVDSAGTIDTAAPIVLMVKKTVRRFENGSVKVYPNPYKGYVNISYSLKADATISIQVFNILGDKVATIENTTKSAGIYKERFSAAERGLGAGVYFIKVTQNGQSETIKVIETN